MLSKTPKWAAPRNGPVVTTFVFRVRNVPAALYKSLGGFATNGVNMTKLESYMVEGEFSATQFLADVDGHPEDPPLQRALEELDVLLARSAHPRRLPGAQVPHRVAEAGGVAGVVSGAGLRARDRAVAGAEARATGGLRPPRPSRRCRRARSTPRVAA